MAKDFSLVSNQDLQTVLTDIASSTVIEAGDMVAVVSGLVVKATAAHTAIAYCPTGSANGETVTEITIGDEFELEGTGDAVFAITQRGTTVDLVVNSTNQEIDVGTSSTNVLKIFPGLDAGTVGSTSKIRVKINAPIY